VPDLSHLWQRFLLASALLFGLVLGVAATVFGYSNTSHVAVGWSVFHIASVPLWTVALVPLAVVLVAGTVYHWFNSLHHFTEHMCLRRRIHELEAEVTSLRAHLDGLLEMPDHTATKQPAETISVEPASNGNGDDKSAKKARKRISLSPTSETEPVAIPTDGATELPPREESSPET